MNVMFCKFTHGYGRMSTQTKQTNKMNKYYNNYTKSPFSRLRFILSLTENLNSNSNYFLQFLS